MKYLNKISRVLFVTSLLWNGSVHAADECDTEAKATPKNVYQCKLPEPVKVKLVAAWVVDPEIQKTADFDYLVNGVSSFFDATILNPVFVQLLKQADLSSDKKALVVNKADSIDGKMDPEIKTFIETTALPKTCSNLGLAGLSKYQLFGPKNQALSSAIHETIRYCEWSKQNLTVAMGIVGQGYPAGVLPLMDLLSGWKSDIDAKPDSNCAGGSGYRWVEEFQNAVVLGLQSLGKARVQRARNLVDSFMNVHCSVMANAARDASRKINIGSNLIAIKVANPSAIEWGKNMIREHDGEYLSVQLEILDAFAVAMKIYPNVKVPIKSFLREEYESGYHSGNAKFNERLNTMSL